MKWTEDGIALLTGLGILLAATLVFVGFPLLGWEPQGLRESLGALSVKLGKWQYDPRDAFGSISAVGWWFASGGGLAVILAIGLSRAGVRCRHFLAGYGILFALATLAELLAAQSDFKTAGLGFALWSILLGMFIGNLCTLPDWMTSAMRHEMFVKTGLILLGAEVLFSKVMAIGLPGIFVAWVVTPVVLVCTYWFGQRVLGMTSKSLNLTISADMSVCGVSAAIATAAACRAKKEELTLAIGLSMFFTSVMMVVMPALIRALGMPEVLGGAWMGGTIDATGAVVAAGAFLGDTALHVAATIKMIQNILIGVVAFAVAVYWTTKVEPSEGRRISLEEIWRRFPKFILGFVAASIGFSLLLHGLEFRDAATWLEDDLIGLTKSIRGKLFCLAFVSIGLATRWKELREQFSGGKPLLLYVAGQTLNLALTLLAAWVMFYLVFPEVTAAL